LSAAPLPELPDYSALDPAALSVAELREWHERLWAWLEAAQAAPLSAAPDEDLMDEVHEALVAITAERRDRQRDEPAPRGG
jgi:hypothetical protein